MWDAAEFYGLPIGGGPKGSANYRAPWEAFGFISLPPKSCVSRSGVGGSDSNFHTCRLVSDSERLPQPRPAPPTDRCSSR